MDDSARDFAIRDATSSADDALEAIRDALTEKMDLPWWKRGRNDATSILLIALVFNMLVNATRSPNENSFTLLGLSLWLGFIIVTQASRSDRELKLLFNALVLVRAEMKAKN